MKLKLLENYKHVALILGLLIVSWWGSLDALANRVNAESITDAAVIYGIARSINAAVSLLQSAEVGAFPLCQGSCPLLYFSLIFRRAG